MIFPMELKYETVEFHIETTKKNKAMKKPKNKEFKEERKQQRRQRLTKKEEEDANQQRKKKADKKQQTQTPNRNNEPRSPQPPMNLDRPRLCPRIVKAPSSNDKGYRRSICCRAFLLPHLFGFPLSLFSLNVQSKNSSVSYSSSIGKIIKLEVLWLEFKGQN